MTVPAMQPSTLFSQTIEAKPMTVFITTNKYGGKQRTYNLDDLPIAGSFAHKLPGPDLCREMQKLGISGLVPTQSHQEMSLILANFLAEQKEQAA
jgi:hypothetical protein